MQEKSNYPPPSPPPPQDIFLLPEAKPLWQACDLPQAAATVFILFYFICPVPVVKDDFTKNGDFRKCWAAANSTCRIFLATINFVDSLFFIEKKSTSFIPYILCGAGSQSSWQRRRRSVPDKEDEE
jgi:hypothetical protein